MSSSQQQQQQYLALPAVALALIAPVYVAIRIATANRMLLSDCDEVYNYWEPLHYLLFHNDNDSSSSHSQQTWEYANQYALRTFAYLLPVQYAAQAWQWLLLQLQQSEQGVMLLQALQTMLIPVNNTTTVAAATISERALLFCLLRSTLAATTAAAELYWLRALYRTRQLGPTATCWLALVLLTCTGMMHAAGAYLPSATWMAVWMVASAAYLQHSSFKFVAVAVTATLCTGWPFGAVCLAPMGLHILQRALVQKQLFVLLLWIVGVTVAVQGVTMMIDAHHYGRWTSPTWNIFSYNAAAGGDELYGVEPVDYYVKNVLLNLNVVGLLGVAALPVRLLSKKRNIDLIVMLSCIFSWLAITVPRPHKEERFLFPIYPCLCLGAVCLVDSALHGIGRVEASLSRHKELMPKQYRLLHAAVWIPVILLSLSRSVALSKYYTAPLQVYSVLAAQPAPETPSLACTCGEWYRFPSSFYLPANVQLGFLPSSFTGQLPQSFSKHGSKPESLAVLQPFNDQNQQEMERYVDVADCTWIIDLDGSDCAPAENSRVLYRAPFLDAEHTATLHRILYLPILHERAVASGQVQYRDYVLSAV